MAIVINSLWSVYVGVSWYIVYVFIDLLVPDYKIFQAKYYLSRVKPWILTPLIPLKKNCIFFFKISINIFSIWNAQEQACIYWVQFKYLFICMFIREPESQLIIIIILYLLKWLLNSQKEIVNKMRERHKLNA
jgi:hypothetical protein